MVVTFISTLCWTTSQTTSRIQGWRIVAEKLTCVHAKHAIKKFHLAIFESHPLIKSNKNVYILLMRPILTDHRANNAQLTAVANTFRFINFNEVGNQYHNPIRFHYVNK